MTTKMSTTEVLLYTQGLIKDAAEHDNQHVVVVDKRKPAENAGSGKEQFVKRGAAFVIGAELLIKNLPLAQMALQDAGRDNIERSQLMIRIRIVEDEFQTKLAKSNSLEECQVLFNELLAKMALLIKARTNLDLTTIERYISTAERLSGWDNRRKPLATLSTHISTSDAEYDVVQTEVPRTQLTHAQAEEYLRIFAPDESMQPEWFKNLPVWEKNYLRNKLEGATLENINEKILTIPSSTRYIPGLANYTEHVLQIYKGGELVMESKRERSAVLAPIDLIHSSQAKERQRMTEGNVAQLLMNTLGERADAQVKLWGNEIANTGLTSSSAIQIPVLFQTLLSPGIVTSTMATLLGPSDNNANMIKNKKIALRKIQKALENSGDLENQKYLARLGLEVENGAIKVKGPNDQIFWVRPSFVSTNHAVNIFRKLPDIKNMIRGLFVTRQTENERNGIILLNNVGNYLGGMINHFEALNKNTSHLRVLKAGLASLSPEHVLQDGKRNDILKRLNLCIADLKANGKDAKARDMVVLLQAVRDYLETPVMKAQNRHRPFFMSSLEQIIADKCGGVGYGSCKSGKDRKGMEVLHTDAMLVYQSIYGELPRYNDSAEKRAVYAKLFAEMFHSSHQQEAAAQNAPGANGIKELKFILPKDLAAVIGDTALQESNVFGGLNKVNLNMNRDQKKQYKKDLEIEKSSLIYTHVSGFFSFVQKTLSTAKDKVVRAYRN